MGISVEGQKCPVCGAYIFDNDDLVFCPECGAPHHRDCYEALGHCAYKDKHGTAEGYSPAASEDTAKPPEKEPVFAKGETECRFCGERLEEKEKVCHNCGRPQMVGTPPFGHTVVIDSMGGVAPDEDIDDVKAKEVKEFVVINTQRYLPKFKAMNSKKKSSWNWAAFLVPHVWFFYRKMYLPGILFSVLTITASLFLLPLSAVVRTFPTEATASTALLAQKLVEHFSSGNALPLYLALAGGLVEIIVRIVAGFMGDRLYRNAVIEGVKKVKAREDELEVPLKAELARKGGVNVFLGLISLFSLDLILEWIGVIYTLL